MSWWEGVKAAWKVLPRLGDTDPYTRILKLEDRLDEERQRRREVEERLRRLERAEDLADEIVADGNFYYLPGEGQERDGPFCTRCWDVDDELVRILRLARGRWKCPNCTVLRGRA